MICQKIAQGLPAVVFLVCLGASQADAIAIHPQCKTMHDKIGCSCALANGGRIIQGPDGPRWSSASGTNNGRPTNQAFTQCIINSGRR